VCARYEATASLDTQAKAVKSPLAAVEGAAKLSESVAIIPVLRAGLGMENAMLELLPNAAVHHIGMYRLKGSTLPVQYYNRLPKDDASDVAFVLDPLIASAM
jgi:uracil phosphoribosyltransferase